MTIIGDGSSLTRPADLNAALQDVIPYLTLTGANHDDDSGACTIQAKDAAGNNLAQRFDVRTWIADAEFSEPDAQTGFTVTTGELHIQAEAHADLTVISDASGTIVMDIVLAGAASVYVMAQINGRIYSSGEIAITSGA